jgi:hypothetical protein
LDAKKGKDDTKSNEETKGKEDNKGKETKNQWNGDQFSKKKMANAVNRNIFTLDRTTSNPKEQTERSLGNNFLRSVRSH